MISVYHSVVATCVGHSLGEAPRAKLWPQVVGDPQGQVVGMRHVVDAAFEFEVTVFYLP